jgi:hypothetical protein
LRYLHRRGLVAADHARAVPFSSNAGLRNTWRTNRDTRAAPHKERSLAGVSWTLPGELGVYCEGHPQAYSIGPVLHERHSQYDLWPNPIADGERFRGKTFLVVGGMTEELRQAFEVVGPTQFMKYSESGQPATGWWLTVCRGFRGRFPTPDRISPHY